MDCKKSERGAVTIVEATIVFPIVFLVLFLLIYLGNAYYLKSHVDSYVEQYAIMGAAECADPILYNGSIPTSSSAVSVKPYRYIFTGYMDQVSAGITSEMQGKLKTSGFFSNMPMRVTSMAEADVNIFYSTFIVEAEMKIQMPIKILDIELDILKFNSRAEVPIVDTGEFIRNVDMALDFIESNQAIQEGMSKVKDFMSKIGGGSD